MEIRFKIQVRESVRDIAAEIPSEFRARRKAAVIVPLLGKLPIGFPVILLPEIQDAADPEPGILQLFHREAGVAPVHAHIDRLRPKLADKDLTAVGDEAGHLGAGKAPDLQLSRGHIALRQSLRGLLRAQVIERAPDQDAGLLRRVDPVPAAGEGAEEQ